MQPKKRTTAYRSSGLRRYERKPGNHHIEEGKVGKRQGSMQTSAAGVGRRRKKDEKTQALTFPAFMYDVTQRSAAPQPTDTEKRKRKMPSFCFLKLASMKTAGDPSRPSGSCHPFRD
jgi:hypothetical protein